ncbi:unnamed protein product, partial [Ectocarpus sp. 12 AP-2014]
NVQVGDVLEIRNRENIPADLVMLSCSDPKGTCFVMTSNLDGETNLKPRVVSPDLRAAIAAADGAAAGALVECDLPNQKLEHFDGALVVRGLATTPKQRPYRSMSSVLVFEAQLPHDRSLAYEKKMCCRDDNCPLPCPRTPEISLLNIRYHFVPTFFLLPPSFTSAPGGQLQRGERIPLHGKNTLLRGCQLRNTEWCRGVVVYTGRETKIQMNAAEPAPKSSSLKPYVDRETLHVLCVQIVLCVVAAVFAGIRAAGSDVENMYFILGQDEESQSPALVAFLKFWSFIIIFTNFVPISLLITLDMVKVFQSKFIAWDRQMYHE